MRLVMAKRVSVVTGTGVSMGPAANAVEWLAWALVVISGSLDRQGGLLVNPGVIRPQSENGPMSIPRVTGPPPASRPEFKHAYGEYPCAVLSDEIDSGHVKAMLVLGGNIAASFPNSARMAASLKRLDVLTVTDVRRTQTTELATHVLATSNQLERPDATFIMDNSFPLPFAQYTPAVGDNPSANPSGPGRSSLNSGSRDGLKLETRLGDDDQVPSKR